MTGAPTGTRVFAVLSDALELLENEGTIRTERDSLHAVAALLQLAATGVYSARGVDMSQSDNLEIIGWSARTMAELSDRIDRRNERERAKEARA